MLAAATLGAKMTQTCCDASSVRSNEGLRRTRRRQQRWMLQGFEKDVVLWQCMKVAGGMK